MNSYIIVEADFKKKKEIDVFLDYEKTQALSL